MRLIPVLAAALSFIVLAKAQNFSSYLPECAPPCVQETLNSTKLCASLDDNKCLCTNLPQLLFPSISCFTQTCDNRNFQALRSEILSGWTKFCNDLGVPTSAPTGLGPFGPGNPFPSPPATPPATPPVTPTLPPTTASSDTSPTAGPSGLTTGAKAGIGVGVGIGTLAVIGGLAFLWSRRKRIKATASGEGEGGGGGEYKSPPPPPSSEMTAHAELPSGPSPFSHTELSADDNAMKELPVAERPVELWHEGSMPAELSADAEVSRGPKRRA
ncbi:hypothetical protein F5Y14DRAFT_228274 [Nemania sp. NC0429]|nr:hypothetical protein F5Y14DRAFT_228274 [Nemania sp. NC0429]